MAGNLVKSVMLKIVADDGDSKAKLDAITRKAEELGREHPDIKVKVDSAAASAKLRVLKAELKAAGDQAQQDQGRFAGMAGGLRQAALGVLGFSDVQNVAAQGGSRFKMALAAIGPATGLLEAPVSGLVVGIGGLVSGLTAGAAGLGAFGLVASGVQGQVSKAVSAYQTAMSTTGKAQQTALTQYHAFMGALTGSQRELVRSENSAESAWQSFVNKNTAGVSKVMSQGFGLLPKVFAAIQPFLAPVEHALSGIISQISTGLSSSGFKGFIDMLARNAGPAITSVAGIIGHIVVGIGGIIKAFMPMAQTVLGGLDKITAKFATWGQTLTQHSGFQSLMSMARADMPYVISIVKNLGAAIVHLVSSMTGLSTFSNSKMLLQMAAPLAQLVNWLSKANPDLLRMGLYAYAAYGTFGKLSGIFGALKGGFSAITTGVGAVKMFAAGFTGTEVAMENAGNAAYMFGGKISGAFSAGKAMVVSLLEKMGILTTATEAETVAQGELDVAMDANPIGLIVVAIGVLVAAFAILWTHSAAFRNFWKGLWHEVVHLVGDAVTWIKGHWQLVLSILTGPIGAAAIFIITHWKMITQGAQDMFHAVVFVFYTIPMRIMSAVAGFGHLLWSAGVSLLQGLIGGIESMIGSVISTVTNIGSSILGSIKGALGIGSPSRITWWHGQMLAAGLIGGMDSMHGQVAAAAGRLAGAAAGHPALAAGAGGGGGTLRLEVTGGSGMSGLDHMFMTWLQHQVRAMGGDPGMFQKKVAYR